MARPERIEDLPLRSRIGATAVTIDPKKFPRTAAGFRSIADLLELCERVGMVPSEDYSGIALGAPLGPVELDDALRHAQEDWDLAEKQYDACLASTAMPESGIRYRVEAWCRSEGKDLPWSKDSES